MPDARLLGVQRVAPGAPQRGGGGRGPGHGGDPEAVLLGDARRDRGDERRVRPPGLRPAADAPTRVAPPTKGAASNAPRFAILGLVVLALSLAGWRGLDGTNPFRRRASLDGELLLVPLQGAGIVGDRARAKDVVGYLVVTHVDISDTESSYVFGLADVGRGVMSTARFADGDPRAARRSIAQALSSTGLILGAPRCQTPTCPRVYAGDVVSHDEKGETLCGVCVDALQQLPRSRR